MRATLLLNRKEILANGAIVQIRVWRLPETTRGRPHGLKYSLYYGRANNRIVGYDNERGKGDHRHYRGVEEAYDFIDLETLIRDFQRDVARELLHE